MDIVRTVVDLIASIGVPLVYLLVLGLAMAETAIFADVIVPGEIGMIVAGAAAARGDADVWTMIAAGAVGAVVGDSISYLVGRKVGVAAICRWDWLRERLEPKLERAERFVERRGGLAVLFGRFVGALRAVVPVVVGAGGMAYPRFLAWNVVASGAWVTAVILLGFFLGRQLTHTASSVVTWVSVGVVGGLVAFWVGRWLWKRYRATD